MSTSTVLPEGLPAPAPLPDGLDGPYWEGTRRHELVLQRCKDCQTWQWGPEWICHSCLSHDVGWQRVEARGRVFSWERVWHPVHPALKDAVPYVVLLVELPEADHVRVVGNLVGDPLQDVRIGDPVEAVFEDHDDGSPAFTLVHWKRVGGEDG
jgi:uncharacterized OB-fold protein